MILNTTHLTSKVKKIIAEFIGNEFSFIEKLKLRGVGSYKMMIEECSESIQEKLNFNEGINYCSFELRKKGMMLHFLDHNYEKTSWLIPYYKLVVYKTSVLSIYSDSTFVKLKIDRNFKLNKKFLAKMLKLKSVYADENNFQSPLA